MLKRNVLAATIISYLDVQETKVKIFWSHICSDLMGDLVSFDRTTIWEGDMTMTDNLIKVANGLWISEKLYLKHKEKIEDQNYLINFTTAITPYNNKIIRERLFNV